MYTDQIIFMIDDTLRARNNGIKLKCRQVNSDCTKFFFANFVVREWNKLPPSVVQRYTIDSVTSLNLILTRGEIQCFETI